MPGEAVGDKVLSTQTAEMLQRLARAPRLDLERYAIEGEVDRGGMGAILKLRDRQLNRRLAMKVLLDREAPRDELEQQLAHQLLGRFLEEAQQALPKRTFGSTAMRSIACIEVGGCRQGTS